MLPLLRSSLTATVLVLSATAALAGASGTPAFYQPDPALKTETLSQLQARVRQACTIVQAKLQGGSESAMQQRCDCYAGRTMRALSAEEIQAYRETGVFNDSAREKALAAIDRCRLQRPTL